MATLIACAGWEQGTTGGLATGNATNRYCDRTAGTLGTTVEIVTAAARSGTYGLRLSPSAGTAHAGWANSANNGILGASGTLVGSFYFRFPTLPSTDFVIWQCLGTAGGQDVSIKYLTSTTGLQGIFGASTQLGAGTISANTWYRIDFRSIHNANPHTLEWKVDGTDQTTVSLAVASESIFNAGFGNDAGTQTGVVHIDDAVLSLTSGDYPLGGHAIHPLTADPADTVTLSGTTTNFQTFSGATPTLTAWNATTARNNVDERPPNLGSSQDGFCQINLAATNYVQVPMATYTLQAGETITGLRAVACGWQASTGSATIGLRSFNGTTETTLLAAQAHTNLGNNTTTPGWICKMCTLADFDTQAELDALAFRIGFSGDATPDIGIQAIYAEVAVQEATAVTHEGQASLTVAGDRTATATADHSAAATDTATGAVTAAASAERPAAASLTGTATITAAADTTAPPVEVAATFTATGTAGSAAEGTHPVGGSLSATATRAAVAVAEHPVAASSTATGSATAGGSVSRPIAASVAATGTGSSQASVAAAAASGLTATAAATAGADVGTPPVEATATVTGTASISAAAARAIIANAQATHTATIAAAAMATHPAGASLAATATGLAAAVVTALPTATLTVVALVGAEASVAGPVVAASGTATIGSAAASAAGFLGRIGSATVGSASDGVSEVETA